MAFVFAEEFAGLGEVTNNKERQKVRFVDDLMEPKRVRLFEPWPREEIAHLRHDVSGQVPCGCHLHSWTCRGRTQENQCVPCNGRLLDLFMCQVGGKAGWACRRRWWAMQGRKANFIQQCPSWLDAAKPAFDGWVLQNAESYHCRGLTGLVRGRGLLWRRAIRSASTSAAGPTRCARQWRQPSFGRRAQQVASLGSRQCRA